MLAVLLSVSVATFWCLVTFRRNPAILASPMVWAGMLRNVAAVDCLAGEMVRACAIILLFVVALRIARPHTIPQRRCIVATWVNRPLCKTVEIWQDACIGGRDAADPLQTLQNARPLPNRQTLGLVCRFLARLVCRESGVRRSTAVCRMPCYWRKC